MTPTPEILTSEEVARFRHDGYLRYRPVLAAAELESLRAALDRLIAEELAGSAAEERPPEFAYGHQRGPEVGERTPRALHQFVNMWKVTPEYHALIHHPVIASALRDLTGASRVRLWHDQVISKPPDDNGKFAFHHDFYLWPLDRPRMVTCWLALDDATAANGCMHVIPGSHRDPRYQPPDCELVEELHLAPAPRGDGDPGSLYDAVRTWDADRAVPVDLAAGECMFHHCLNYHMTPQNQTDRQRRAFVIIGMPDGTRYRHDQSPRHPCTQHLQLEDRAVLDGPGFPVLGEPDRHGAG